MLLATKNAVGHFPANLRWIVFGWKFGIDRQSYFQGIKF